MMMEEKKFRGDLLIGYYKAVKKFWGVRGLKECEEYVGIKMDDIKSTKWYPIEYHSKMHKFLGEKGEQYVTRAARQAIHGLGMLSYLVRFVSIKSLLKKAPKSYDDTFNFGVVEIDIEENSAIAKLKDVVTTGYTCLAWKGVFQGTLEVTKTEGTVEIIDHEEKGENDCFFKIEWK